MENVLDIPLRLLFIKLAVACDDDENNDDVAVVEVVDEAAMVVVIVVADVIGLLTIGVVYGVEYVVVVNDVEYDDIEYDVVVNGTISVNGGSTICGCCCCFRCNGLSVYAISLLSDVLVVVLVAPK